MSKERKAEKALDRAAEVLAWARFFGTEKEIEESIYRFDLARRDYFKAIGDHAGAFSACPVTRII